jgi:glutaminyl-tRNA synthetase
MSLYIEREDFMEVPRRNGFACSGTNGEIEIAYIIKCDEVIKDDKGNVIELRCSYIPESQQWQ